MLAANMLIMLVLYVLAAISASVQGVTNYYSKDSRSNVDFSNGTTNISLVRTARGRVLSCAAVCNNDAQCVGFSQVKLNEDVSSCKIARTGAQMQVANDSNIFWKATFDSDGYSTFSDPFRYKVFNVKVGSPQDALSFCVQQNALLPVNFPSLRALESLRTFLASFAPTGSRYYIGINLAADYNNGTLFFNTQRDWPLWTNLANIDPAQPWAPGEPQQHPGISNASLVGVMINSHGFWQTVNTAGDAVLSTGTICMRHATYLTYTLFGHFNRFIRHEKATYLSQPDAAADCRTQDADLVRLYGQKGKAVLAYFMNNGLHGVEGWFAGTQVTIGQALVSFPDGVVVDNGNRFNDSRQFWNNNDSMVLSDPSRWCLGELFKHWCGHHCTTLRAYTCEGLF